MYVIYLYFYLLECYRLNWTKKTAFDLLKPEEYVISKAFVIAVLEYIQSRAIIKIAFNDD